MGNRHSAILWLPDTIDRENAIRWSRSFLESRSTGERLVCLRSPVVDKFDERIDRQHFCVVDRPPERMLNELIRIVKVRYHFIVLDPTLPMPSDEIIHWSQWLEAHRHAMADVSAPRPCATDITKKKNDTSLVPVTRLGPTVWLVDLDALAMLNVIRQTCPNSRGGEDVRLMDDFGARLARWNLDTVRPSTASPSGGIELAEFRGAYFDPNACPPLPEISTATTQVSTSSVDRFALVFRTHLWNETMETLVKSHKRQLLSGGDDKYDLIVQLNVPNETEPILFQAEQWCRNEGIEFTSFTDRQVRSDFPFYADAWRQSQVSFIYFGRAIKDSSSSLTRWRAIWFIEYDVRYSGANIFDLLRAHDRHGSHWAKRHLLGTHVQRFDEQPEWLRWYDFPQDLRRVIRLDEQWKYFAPLTRLTPQAIRYLDEFMTATHTHHNVEIWVPSVIAFGFGHSALANLDRRFWNADTMRYRPIHAPDTESFLALSGLPADHLCHPIK